MVHASHPTRSSLVDIEAHRLVVGHGASASPRRSRAGAPTWANVRFVEQTIQQWHRRAAMIGMHTAIPGDDLTTTRPWSCVPATPRCCGPRRWRGWSRPTVQRQCGDGHQRVMDDPRLWGSCAGCQERRRSSGVGQSSRSATPTTSSARVREVGDMGMYAFRRDRSGSARRYGTCSPRQRAGRVLPDRRGGRSRQHGAPSGQLRGDAGRDHGVNADGSWPWPSASCRARINRSWLLNGVTRCWILQVFLDVTGALVATYVVPRHHLAGRHGHRRWQRDRPDVRLSLPVAARLRHRARRRPRSRGWRRCSRRAVRAPAAGQLGSSGCDDGRGSTLHLSV